MPLPEVPPRTPERPFDVVGLGESSLDFVAVVSGPLVPDSKWPLDRFEVMPGGQTATALVACARLGHLTRYVGALGTDDAGTAIERALSKEGVDVAAEWRAGVPSRVAVVLVDPDSGHRTVLERRDPRLTLDRRHAVSRSLTGRILLVDGVDIEASIIVAREARAAGIPTVVDVENADEPTRELLRHVTVLIVPEAFLTAFAGSVGTGEALRQIDAEYRPAIAIATLGAGGSLARFEDREIHTPALAVEVVDTTGAGDAFRGGFVSAWLQLGGSNEAGTLLRYANTVAGMNCRALGAQTGLPTRTELGGVL